MVYYTVFWRQIYNCGVSSICSVGSLDTCKILFVQHPNFDIAESLGPSMERLITEMLNDCNQKNTSFSAALVFVVFFNFILFSSGGHKSL
jgi:hypothetical protein